jgi:hypothetical protein
MMSRLILFQVESESVLSLVGRSWLRHCLDLVPTEAKHRMSSNGRGGWAL